MSSSGTGDCTTLDGSFDFFTSATPLHAGASGPCTAQDEGGEPTDFGGALLDFGDWGTADSADATLHTAGGDDATAAAETSFELTWGDDPAAAGATVEFEEPSPPVDVPCEAPPHHRAPRVASAMPPPSPLPPKMPTAAAPAPTPPTLRCALPTPPPSAPTPQQPPRAPSPATSAPIAAQAVAPSSSQRPSGGMNHPTSRPPLRPPSAAAVAPGISKKAVDELVAEADGLLELQPRASGGAMSDAAFRSAVAAMKLTASSEAQLLANRTAQLLKAAVACVDRVGPNPTFAALVGDSQHAGTPVLHLTHLVKPQLLERVHRLRALGL